MTGMNEALSTKPSDEGFPRRVCRLQTQSANPSHSILVALLLGLLTHSVFWSRGDAGHSKDPGQDKMSAELPTPSSDYLRCLHKKCVCHLKLWRIIVYRSGRKLIWPGEQAKVWRGKLSRAVELSMSDRTIQRHVQAALNTNFMSPNFSTKSLNEKSLVSLFWMDLEWMFGWVLVAH